MKVFLFFHFGSSHKLPYLHSKGFLLPIVSPPYRVLQNHLGLHESPTLQYKHPNLLALHYFPPPILLMNNLYSFVFQSIFVTNGRTSVVRAIIYQYNFYVRVSLPQQTINTPLYILLHIIYSDDKTNFWNIHFYSYTNYLQSINSNRLTKDLKRLYSDLKDF